jgi:CRP-like cAMP-binding protein
MELTSILPILKKIPVFADLNEQEHNEIVKNIVMNYFPVGHVFFSEGDDGSAGMYIIKRGMVKISRKGTFNSEKEVAILSDNDFFGEMALVLNEPRNATATAIGECEVFQISKADFEKLMQTSPVLANKISTEFIAREKKNKI